MKLLRREFTLGLLTAVAVGENIDSRDWGTGFLAGLVATWIVFRLIERSLGSEPTYRRWYLMCRNELERVDPSNKVLADIGPRTSKREKWEE